MANTATFTRDCPISAACAGDATYKGSRFASVKLSIDQNYAQGGYDILPILKAAGLPITAIGAFLPMGPAFQDSVGGSSFICNYYPSAHKLMFYTSVEAGNVDTVKEIGDGALGATYVVNALVMYV